MRDSAKTALLIIDMQNDFVLPDSPGCIAGAHATIPKLVKVLEYYRKKDKPVFHVVREYREDGSDIEGFRYQDFVDGKKFVVPGTPGCEIVKELTPTEGEYRIVKNNFSGFMNTELDFMLRRLSVTDLVVTGTQYPNCVRTTVYDAVALGYTVTLATDATSAATPEITEANIKDIRNIGVRCILADELCTN